MGNGPMVTLSMDTPQDCSDSHGETSGDPPLDHRLMCDYQYVEDAPEWAPGSGNPDEVRAFLQCWSFSYR